MKIKDNTFNLLTNKLTYDDAGFPYNICYLGGDEWGVIEYDRKMNSWDSGIYKIDNNEIIKMSCSKNYFFVTAHLELIKDIIYKYIKENS